MKLIKVTNPVWLGEIAPKINDYTDKISIPGIDYNSMLAYFRNVVQFGGDKAEFHVVMDNGKAVSFAQWSVRTFPYFATCSLDNIYKWVKNHEPTELIMESYINFGLKNRCTQFYARCNNEYIAKLLEKYADSAGYKTINTGAIECVMRKEG